MITQLRTVEHRLAALAYHVTEEVPDLPESLVARVIDAHMEASAQLLAATAAAEKARDRADDERRDRLDDARQVRAGMEAWLS